MIVVGLDPSLNNWGVARGIYTPGTSQVQVTHLDLIKPVTHQGKQVRQNSKDLLAAQQLFSGAIEALRDAQAIFVEVPVGSQSARAMASYGICVGILGSLRGSGIPFFEVTPTEVKWIATRSKTATKNQMIQWAVNQHPEAPWPTYTRGGQELITESIAEHMADAVGAIYAGLNSDSFKQFLHLKTA